ncbi:DUF3718 domain-containing protein [uncultured Paraglaciecola sp.]|uniref:DUF3718 domain-containing protein n=1 Tax=uncultured Paraglaciecola sp. TaxID=1765024 RepID=UPI00263634DE|nr:DUF3718 domain-containing protein [uncultured Paraglaciecola sp.]
MFKFKMIVTAVFCTLPLLANAGVTYVVGDNSTESRLCVSAAMDSPIGFYKASRDSGKSMHYISNNISCNDLVMADFAYQVGNIKNAKRLSKFQKRRGQVNIKEIAQVRADEVENTDRVVVIYGR